ncbi:hypothetical protein QBC40DRAFT_52856 [Triangularia verruculosa]|uniref:Uncharacterized protein n=1 Tax=Triangularia verruculosa TaxID=2587418 RepID=A0AAN6XJK9_9PEZI|nr:hypothetical protein QBC40DRAFT_52856 [Triangularia verruculosa]
MLYAYFAVLVILSRTCVGRGVPKLLDFSWASLYTITPLHHYLITSLPHYLITSLYHCPITPLLLFTISSLLLFRHYPFSPCRLLT